MNPHRNPGALVAALVLAGNSLPALADSARPEPLATQAPAAPRPMKQTGPLKPNGSGVTVRFRIDGSPRIGQPLSVTLNFDGVTDPAGATVNFTADAGLSLQTESLPPGPIALPAGRSSDLVVQVVPSTDALAYLNVFTTQRGVTSATSVPVQVGNAAGAMKSSGELKQTPAGEKIISMPVR
jgi:hypothetical protein